MSGIVLALITRNSLSQLGSLFKRVLESSLQVPYHAIILVDDGSDGTREYVERFARMHGKEVVATSSRLYGFGRPTRATARQTAIDVFFENFSDEWLFFLDDDAVLRPGWWRDVERYTREERVGEIWGVNWEANEARRRLLEKLGYRQPDYLIEAFRVRGGTHDTLYRRAALKGASIPPCLHELEDAYLHHWVLCNGWEYRVSLVGVYHRNPRRASRHPYMLATSMFAIMIGLVDGYTGGVRDYFTLLRPILGFARLLPAYISVYGFTRGLREAIEAQYSKLVRRYWLIRAARVLRDKLGRVRGIDVCGLMRDGETLRKVLCG